MTSTQLRVDGMTCKGCAALVRSTLEEDAEGVKSAEVDLDKGVVTVEYDEAVASLEKMAEVVREAGYTPVLPAS